MPAWLVPAIIAGVSAIAQGVAQRRQNKKNKEMAEFQVAANTEFQNQQNEYNSPANQMRRFSEAGLNPNLVYGQGNPGNQSSPVQAPLVENYQRSPFTDSVGVFNQSMLAQSQVQAQNAQTRRIGVLTQLNQLQAEVLAQNPLLHGALEPIISALKSTAESKAANAGMDTAKAEWFKGDKSFNINGVPTHGPAGILKLETELQNLLQQFNLGQADAKIKAEVLQSKEFQNAILEVQKNFIKDADIGPQQIYQFIILLLTKML